MTAVPFAKIVRALKHAVVIGLAALTLAGVVAPVSAEDVVLEELVFPAPLTQAVHAKRQQFFEIRPGNTL